MNNGWDRDFDLQSVSDEVIKGIRDNIKKCDIILQKQNEVFLSRKQEELRRLKTKLDELMIYNHIHKVKIPEPKYCKYIYCPCAKGGEGGFFLDERDE